MIAHRVQKRSRRRAEWSTGAPRHYTRGPVTGEWTEMESLGVDVERWNELADVMDDYAELIKRHGRYAADLYPDQAALKRAAEWFGFHINGRNPYKLMALRDAESAREQERWGRWASLADTYEPRDVPRPAFENRDAMPPPLPEAQTQRLAAFIWWQAMKGQQ